MDISTLTYIGHPNCLRLSNGTVDLVVSTQFGPRILHYGPAGGQNLFAAPVKMTVKVPRGEWCAYGGHRFWISPESLPETYAPDNDPIQVTKRQDGLRLTPLPDPANGLQRELDISLGDEGTHVQVAHLLTSHAARPVLCSPWALTVMALGGVAVVPFESPRLVPSQPRPPRLTPSHALQMWDYTALNDQRWNFGRRYLLLRQVPGMEPPQKMGVHTPAGWAAYVRDGWLFFKTFTYDSQATYPDFGATVEVYTNADMLELETLGPQVLLAPGQTIAHVENWYLNGGVSSPQDDKAVDETLLPLVLKVLK